MNKGVLLTIGVILLLALILFLRNSSNFGDLSCNYSESNDQRIYPSGKLPGELLNLTQEEINNTLLPSFIKDKE